MKVKESYTGLGQITLLVWWILGVVVTSGFWSTFFATFFPPYAWYLGLEWIVSFFPNQV